MKYKEVTSFKLIFIILLLASAIFVLDMLLPHGVAGGVPYVAVVLVSLWSPNDKFSIYVAIVVSLLTIAGHFYTPLGAEFWVDYTNRFLALSAIWVTTIVSLKRKRAERARARMEQIAAARERLALVGEMAAGVAHEFRNPMDGVLNCIKLLRSRMGNELSTQELLDLADEGLRRMDAISARMLRLGRDEMGPKTPTNMVPVIESAMAFVRVRAQNQGVVLKSSIDADVPPLTIDAERMSEAILNLLTNSLDACAEGGSIRVKVRRLPTLNTIEITVWDNGPGIPRNIRKRVFEPFFTTKPVGKGSGLGLAITRKIVEDHRGIVAVADDKKAGTTVRILLPIQSGPEKGRRV